MIRCNCAGILNPKANEVQGGTYEKEYAEARENRSTYSRAMQVFSRLNTKTKGKVIDVSDITTR